VDNPNNAVGNQGEPPVRKCRIGFTLVEMLIVMAIVVLIVTMAVPSIRVLTGTRSISVAQNQLAAVITRAREDAIALQDIRGVLFYLDPISGRVGAAIVQTAVLNDTFNMRFNSVVLDTLPNNDSLLLPVGVGLQTIMNGMDSTIAPSPWSAEMWHVAAIAQAKNSNPYGGGTPSDDRYLGFNDIKGASYHGLNLFFYVGGCVLFDGNGRLVQRPYAFQMTSLDANGNPIASNLCRLMGFDVNAKGVAIAFPCVSAATYMLYPIGSAYPNNNGSIIFMPGCPNNWNGFFPKVPLLSQMGFVLFDHDAFRGLGFTDVDADVQAPNTYSTAWPTSKGGDGIHSEMDEETWLDTNSTPIMINRVNGTLIRSE
jgi:prepilin-type N-terminal cleavage/methylation domain-containing protein